MHHNVTIDSLSTGGVRLGDGVTIGAYSTIEATGIVTNIGIGLTIGSGSGIGAYSFIGAAGGVDIGTDVIMGQYVSFHSENHHYERRDILIKDQGVSRQGIRIGNNCWIGSKVTFLDGAVVGSGCVVAAGSVVRGVIPENSVVAGVPARVIRSR